MSASPMLTTFNGGEITPLLNERTDLEKYKSSCQELENMICLTQGGVTRRPGTKWLGNVANLPWESSVSDRITRLIPFARSSSLNYVLEFIDKWIVVWYQDEEVILDYTTLDAFDATKSYVRGDYVNYNSSATLCTKSGIGGSATWNTYDHYIIASPYTEDELADLKYVQSLDVMYIVSANHPVMKLSSRGASDFTFEEVDFVYATFQDENVDADKTVGLETAVSDTPSDWIDGISYSEGAFVTYSGTIYKADRDIKAEENYTNPSATNAPWTSTTTQTTFTKGTLVTMVSTNYDFTADDVGKYMLLKVPRDDNSLSDKLNSTGDVTATMAVKGDWNLVTHGTWDGTIELQRSYNNGSTWLMARTYGATGDRNVDVNGSEDIENAIYRVEMTVYNSGTCRVDFNVEDAYYNRVYKIVGFTSSNEVTVQLRESEDSPPTTADEYMSWAMGAWGGDFGYPRTIAFYEERLCFGGNSGFASTIWTSRTNDFENLTSGVNDTHALIYTLASDRVNVIQWMIAHNVLIIGTNDDEWSLSSSNRDKPLSPTNVKAQRQSNYGSDPIQAILINDSIFYVKQGGRKVMKMNYDYRKELYVSSDSTVLAEHITEGGIREMAFIKNPYPIIWFIRNDGVMLGFTFEEEQQVMGWHRHTTEGEFVSLCVLPENDEENYLYVKTTRTDRSNDKQGFIEKFYDFKIPDEMSEAKYLDCCREQEATKVFPIGYNQTSNTPFTFNITAHGFDTDDKIQCVPDGDSDHDVDFESFKYKYEIFTVVKIDADNFSIKNEDGTSAWNYADHPYDFYNTAFRKVFNSGFAYIDSIGDIQSLENYSANITPERFADEITFKQYSYAYLIGLPYESKVKPMNIEGQLADGGSQSHHKRINQVSLFLHKTVGALVIADNGKEHIVPFRTASMPMDEAPELFTGYKKVKYKIGYDKEAGILVVQDVPYPMTLLLMQPYLNIHGG